MAMFKYEFDEVWDVPVPSKDADPRQVPDEFAQRITVAWQLLAITTREFCQTNGTNEPFWVKDFIDMSEGQ